MLAGLEENPEHTKPTLRISSSPFSYLASVSGIAHSTHQQTLSSFSSPLGGLRGRLRPGGAGSLRRRFFPFPSSSSPLPAPALPPLPGSSSFPSSLPPPPRLSPPPPPAPPAACPLLPPALPPPPAFFLPRPPPPPVERLPPSFCWELRLARPPCSPCRGRFPVEAPGADASGSSSRLLPPPPLPGPSPAGGPLPPRWPSPSSSSSFPS